MRDGVLIAAAEEERFSRVKHAKRPIPFSAYELPFNAIHYCLKEGGIGLANVEHVAYSYHPYLRLKQPPDASAVSLPLVPPAAGAGADSPWDPLFLCSIVNAPRHLVDGPPHHLKPAFRGARAPGYPDDGSGTFMWHFVPHHLAHAASAFQAGPFSEAAVLTIDGRGELATTAYYVGQGNWLDAIGQVNYPHSIGLLYESATSYLGFLHSSDEYKVMALASYGKPSYLDELLKAIHVGNQGSYTIEYPDFEERFGPARQPGGKFEQKHFDLAASLQAAVEETVLRLAQWLQNATGSPHLCMAGGVALNCVMNSRLRDSGPFEKVWVQPAAGDAGTALGAALWVDAGQRRATSRSYCMEHVFLGPRFENAEIESFLRRSNVPYRQLQDVSNEAAALLAQDRIIGWFQGRMEFGPRALGGRSILASPLRPEMQSRLNEIKDREDFRPVAPVVLEEEAANWFMHGEASPFMLFVDDIRPEKAGLIPAVRHVDGTARVQTVNRFQQPEYYGLIRAFQKLTGVPVLVNTSFNTRGEPIVCTPRDAVECFFTSPLDALVIGPYLLKKEQGA